MKLSQPTNFRPSTASGGKPRSLADLKLGMNSVNKSGVQHNTTCMFDRQPLEEQHQQQEEKDDGRKKLIPCKTHCGYRKPEIDQKNPYIERKA